MPVGMSNGLNSVAPGVEDVDIVSPDRVELAGVGNEALVDRLGGILLIVIAES